ncbi:MAG: saccharopine dehydrogenase C-terminal domain-containing protein [bacterium]
MSFNYAIIGAGRQGVASAYDLVQFGEAAKIYFVDVDSENASRAAAQVKQLTGKDICVPVKLSVHDATALHEILRDIHSMISGVPYYYNLDLTKLAIETSTNMCDFGGNTVVVLQQIELNDNAVEKNISVVPDCGMDPGFNISIIEYLVSKFDKVEEIKSYGAGLPQNPTPPWNYELTFHVNGLTNEYYGDSIYIRNGDVTGVPCLTEFEEMDYPGIGKLEAAVTSGGLSVMPYFLKGKVDKLENKTLRYPGHWQQFKAYSMLGLFETKKIKVGDAEVSPREFYHTLLEPHIKNNMIKDLGIIRVGAKGIKNGKPAEYLIDVLDYYDEKTGFTAMQRLTGWHASTIAWLAAKGETKPGVVPVHEAVSGKRIIDEMKKRGIIVEETLL